MVENEETSEEVKVQELEDEEADRALDEDKQSNFERMENALSPDAAATAPPEWATVPAGLKLPEEGSQIVFIRIPARWTRTPAKGDRVCICWPIGETEERLAYQRSRGDQVRSVSELAKATIRAIDGVKADWSGTMSKQGSVTSFWTDIGPKGRAMLRNYYVRTHSVTEEEALDFFSQHFVSVTVQKG
jgi:hypothetical protein